MNYNEITSAVLSLCVRRSACPECDAQAGEPCRTVTGRAPGTPVPYTHQPRQDNARETWRAVLRVLDEQVCARCGLRIVEPPRGSPWHTCPSAPSDRMAGAIEEGAMLRVAMLEEQVAKLTAELAKTTTKEGA